MGKGKNNHTTKKLTIVLKTGDVYNEFNLKKMVR